MGKLGDIAAILGLGIVGGVLFMFATGRWKFPSLEDIFAPITKPFEALARAPVFGPLIEPTAYRWQAPFWYEKVGEPPETPLGYMIGPILEPTKYERVGWFQYEEIVPPPPPVTYPMPKITPEKVTELKYEYRMTEMERKMRGMML